MQRELTFHYCVCMNEFFLQGSNDLVESLKVSSAEKQQIDASADQISTLSLFLSTHTDIYFTLMPPKREAGVSPTQPPLKMIRIGTDTQEFDPMENKYRLAEEPSFSPFPNNEVRGFDLIVH